MKISKEKYCEHELLPVHECTKCRKTFDVLPSAGDLKENLGQLIYQMTTTDTPRTDAVYDVHTSEYQRRLLSEDLERKLHDAEIRIQAEVSRIEKLNCALAASKAEVERLMVAIVTVSIHNQNMHCYQTKGGLWQQLDEQTRVLRTALNPTNK